jgi:hypothetical protein
MFAVRSTAPGTISVVIDAELFAVLPSLALDTDADAETSGVWDGPPAIGPLRVSGGSEAAAATGPGVVHVADGMSQLQPVPEAAVGANGFGMLTVTNPELAPVPAFRTETV